jgi:hypothetical protein
MSAYAEHPIEADRRPNDHVLRDIRRPFSNARRVRNIIEMP